MTSRAFLTALSLSITMAAQSSSAPARKASLPAVPATPANQQVVKNYGNLPLTFEANQGQTDAKVKFLSRGSGYTLFLTGDEAVFSLHQGEAGDREPAAKGPIRTAPTLAATEVLRMKLHNANPSAKVTGEDELPGKSNYFIGNDPKKWQSSVPTYGKIKYESVYPGIDLVYYGNQRQLEYDFIVSPGSDPHRIQFHVSGADTIKRDQAGDLVLVLADGEVRWHKPVVYQEDGGKRQQIAAQYTVKHKNEVAFEIATYDHTKPLFIDPLVYSTFLGGSDIDQAYGVAVDSAGNVYVAGTTTSTDFPITDPFQSFNGGSYDVFVAKVNPSGSALVYATYLGGSLSEGAYGIATDTAGNAYVTGYTDSADFPTSNPLQPAIGGETDAFITKLNDMGSALIYSTYFGGSGGDVAYAIATDSLGNAFISGYTSSIDFPTVNPLQGASGGNNDAFVAKLDPGGSSLFFSTYLGGSGSDIASGVAVDNSGKVYVTGQTNSADFPTKNAFQPTYAGGGGDAFVTKISPLGTTMVYSTYIGGTSFDEGFGRATDASGNAYLAGHTTSSDFPIADAVQPAYGGGGDAFVSEFAPAGEALVFSTYIGGNSSDEGISIALDKVNNIYVTGDTKSLNFPIVNPPVQRRKGTNYDAFLLELSPAGVGFVYSTYLGASAADFGRGVAVDIAGDAFVTAILTHTIFL
jgi:Beta-propeller repeat